MSSEEEFLKSRALIDGEKTNKEAKKLFKQGKYKAAISKYEQISSTMTKYMSRGYNPERALTDHENLLVKAQSNASQCYINLGDYRAANHHATMAAMFSKRTHVKSIFRAALSFYKMGDIPTALEFVNEVLSLSPSNAAALKLKQSIEGTKNSQPPHECAPFVTERIKSVIAGSFECDELIKSESFENDLKDFRESVSEICYNQNDEFVKLDVKQRACFRSLSGDRYTVRWYHENGKSQDDVFKLYTVGDIEMHKSEKCSDVNRIGGGPSDYGFCTVPSLHTYNKKPGFDANLFWSVMICWRFCGTTFVKSWDEQMKILNKKYKHLIVCD